MTGSSGCGSRRTSRRPVTITSRRRPTTPISKRPIRSSAATRCSSSPAISFAGAGYVLPREGGAGLPVTTINLDRVKLRLVRVNDRNLVPSINAEKLTMSFGTDDVDEVINQNGSLVWNGEMTITGPRNRPVVTAIPLNDMLRDKKPGVYLAVVERTDTKDDGRSTPATNWVLVAK